MVDVGTLIWWLIIILIRIVYFIILVCFAIKDSAFAVEHENNEAEHYNVAKLLFDIVLVAGTLWSWFNMEICFFTFLTGVTTIAILETGDDLEIYSGSFTAFRFWAGIIWLWSHKMPLLYVSIFALVIYVIAIIACGQRSSTEQGGTPKGTSSSGGGGDESDSSVGGGSRWSLRQIIAGLNLNIGGIQQIGNVKIIQYLRDSRTIRLWFRVLASLLFINLIVSLYICLISIPYLAMVSRQNHEPRQLG
ncbi:hypothetical protein RND81_14G243100 [Saponaria officinalis]|uniref:Uncharacterized protein n=1 Tax=Saponaria officinalis TaxID=3572 RepID=A0AAW1GQY6_SAPOF